MLQRVETLRSFDLQKQTIVKFLVRFAHSEHRPTTLDITTLTKAQLAGLRPAPTNHKKSRPDGRPTKIYLLTDYFASAIRLRLPTDPLVEWLSNATGCGWNRSSNCIRRHRLYQRVWDGSSSAREISPC
jgi:hypothetical protein